MQNYAHTSPKPQTYIKKDPSVPKPTLALRRPQAGVRPGRWSLFSLHQNNALTSPKHEGKKRTYRFLKTTLPRLATPAVKAGEAFRNR